MAQYQVMAYHVALPPRTSLGMGLVVVLPDGWTPLSAIGQGATAIVLCSRPVGTPPGGTAPALSSVVPNTLPARSAPGTVDVYGSGSDSSCVAYADGEVREPTFLIDATHLQYTARPDLANPGESHQITVQGNNGISNSLPFTFT